MSRTSYILPGQDLLNLYFVDESFSKLVDSGCVLYVDNCLCLNQPQYIEFDEFGFCHLSQYASLHIDECCFLFDLTEVQVHKEGILQKQTNLSEEKHLHYVNFSAITMKKFSEEECCYDEKNPQNAKLNKLISLASQQANDLRSYPGTFAETLKMHMKNRRLSVQKLAELSLVSVKTIQRLTTDNDYRTTKQTVLAICVGLQLPWYDAEDFLDKSEFKLNSKRTEDIAYKCILNACEKNSIYAVNEILKAHNMPQLDSQSY